MPHYGPGQLGRPVITPFIAEEGFEARAHPFDVAHFAHRLEARLLRHFVLKGFRVEDQVDGLAFCIFAAFVEALARLAPQPAPFDQSLNYPGPGWGAKYLAVGVVGD